MKYGKFLKTSLLAFLCGACLSSCYIGGGTISFETNGAGYTPMPINHNNGQSIDYLPTPSKIGYNFVGWCYDAELANLVYTPITMGTKDFTLYAKYKEIPSSLSLELSKTEVQKT